MLNQKTIKSLATQIAAYCYTQAISNSENGNYFITRHELEKNLHLYNIELEDKELSNTIINKLNEYEGVRKVIIECKDKSKYFYTINISLYTDFLTSIKIGIEKPKLTEDEEIILRYLNKKWKYIVRDKDKTICIFETKPFKSAQTWVCKNGDVSELPFENMYQFIRWESEQPYFIQDLLKGE